MSILWTDNGEDLRLRRTPGGLWTSHPPAAPRRACATCQHPLRAALIFFILATACLAFAAMAGAEERPPAAGIVWSGPRLAPAEAARIMAQAPGMANAANWPPAWPEGGPAAVIIGGRPGDGPYGALATPRIRPACCDLYVNGWPVIGGRYGSGIRGPILGPGHGAKGRR